MTMRRMTNYDADDDDDDDDDDKDDDVDDDDEWIYPQVVIPMSPRGRGGANPEKEQGQ